MMIRNELMIYLPCQKKKTSYATRNGINLRKSYIQDDTDSVNENEDNIAEDSLHSSPLKTDLTLQEELQMRIQNEAKTFSINVKKERF